MHAPTHKNGQKDNNNNSDYCDYENKEGHILRFMFGKLPCVHFLCCVFLLYSSSCYYYNFYKNSEEQSLPFHYTSFIRVKI